MTHNFEGERMRPQDIDFCQKCKLHVDDCVCEAKPASFGSAAESRAAFEAWLKREYPEIYFGFFILDSGDYVSHKLQLAWQSWQAAQRGER